MSPNMFPEFNTNAQRRNTEIMTWFSAPRYGLSNKASQKELFRFRPKRLLPDNVFWERAFENLTSSPPIPHRHSACDVDPRCPWNHSVVRGNFGILSRSAIEMVSTFSCPQNRIQPRWGFLIAN